MLGLVSLSYCFKILVSRRKPDSLLRQIVVSCHFLLTKNRPFEGRNFISKCSCNGITKLGYIHNNEQVIQFRLENESRVLLVLYFISLLSFFSNKITGPIRGLKFCHQPRLYTLHIHQTVHVPQGNSLCFFDISLLYTKLGYTRCYILPVDIKIEHSLLQLEMSEQCFWYHIIF